MAAIQLLITDEGNRHAVTSVLPDHHTTITESELRDADLYLVDEPSFSRCRDTLERRKQRATPVFCPVVLIRRDQTPVSVDLPDPTANSHPLLVDEVLTAPVGQQTLVRAVDNLLTRREQTEQLQKRTRKLEELTSTLRHELRNPLNILDLSLDQARTGEGDAFERCQRAVNRMERMLEETLLIVEQDDLSLDISTVDVPTVTAECWSIIREPVADLDVVTDRQIRADETRLRQLFANLFRNAVEHAGPEVAVTVGPLADGFYVADDGPGIPEEEQNRVFDEGFSTRSAGSGLGLAVVQAVVDAHDWRVRITDSQTGGSRFEISNVEPLASHQQA